MSLRYLILPLVSSNRNDVARAKRSNSFSLRTDLNHYAIQIPYASMDYGVVPLGKNVPLG